jgi:hypothetical protein
VTENSEVNKIFFKPFGGNPFFPPAPMLTGFFFFVVIKKIHLAQMLFDVHG